MDFYNFIINTYKWNPLYLTFDFSLPNIKAINKVFDINKVCLFHLMQAWWRKTTSLGLRKKNIL